MLAAALFALLLAPAAAKKEALPPSTRSLVADCGSNLSVLAASPWPSGGFEVVFSLGQSVTSLPDPPRLSVNGASAKVAAVDSGGAGITGFLVLPSNSLADSIVAIQACSEAFSVDETLVVWVANGTQLALVADASTSKSHVAEMLRRLSSAQLSSPSRKHFARAVGEALQSLSRLDRSMSGEGLYRSLVVVGADEDDLATLASPVGSVDLRDGYAASLLSMSPTEKGGREAAIRTGVALTTELLRRRGALWRAGVCLKTLPDDGALDVVFSTASSMEGACRLSVSGWARVADNTAACSTDDIISGSFPFPDHLQLSFASAAEEAAFQSKRSYMNGSYEDSLLAKDDLQLLATFSSAASRGRPIAAKAHFRGSSTLRECERKSITLHLDGARVLLPDSTTDRLVLVSMCEDFSYVKTVYANSIAHRVGVNRLPERYVSLSIARFNGTVESVGLYLLIQEPDAAFANEATRLVAVVRRRDDPIRATDALKGTPTVVRAPPNSSDAVLQRYDLLASTGATCDPAAAQCYTSLASLMDVDQFVRYIALFTWLGCGDYIDETYFVSSAELDGAFLWRINSWDTDDSFEWEPRPPFSPGRGCHHSGIDAQFDPHDIIFCSEGDLDKVLTRSPDMYARFADHLSFLLRTGLPPSTLADLAVAQMADAWGLLDDDNSTASGLLEFSKLNIIGPRGARESMASALEYYDSYMETRRATLLRSLRIYRARNRRPAAPVPIVAGLGDVWPGSILSPAPPPPPQPSPAPLRRLNEAPAGMPLFSACAALELQWLNATVGAKWHNYTAPGAFQELLIVPAITFQSPTPGLGVSLRGLRLALALNRTTIAVKRGSLPELSPASDFDYACYSGGGVPPQRGQPAPHDMCTQYNITVAVLDDRVEVLFGNGTLAPSSAVDLGVDGALIGLWHSSWQSFVGASAASPLAAKASCEPGITAHIH